MKQHLILTVSVISLLGGAVLAGPPDMKQTVAPAPPPCEYGVGWYAALEGGGNVWQNFDGHRERTFANGDVVDFNVDHNLGGYGGIKIGYVFGHGAIRFAIEEDMFYNGLSTDAHLNLNGVEVAHSSNLLNTGAFMTNFIMRFGGLGKFQPYAGAGVGAYYAASAGADITITRTTGEGPRTFSTGGGASSGSLAWDVVAGCDYYFNCKMSIFAEYHFLDYVALDVGSGNHSFGQHLAGGGIRFHF